MTTTTIYLRDDEGGETEREVTYGGSVTLAQAAREAAEEWAQEGAWGDQATEVTVWWSTEPDEVGNKVRVTIEPNHRHLIRDAVPQWHHHQLCGFDPDDHDWTSEGEGGCDQNPGVYALGGTTISVSRHCRRCGLRREQVYRGAQRNPGEPEEEVFYSWPGA